MSSVHISHVSANEISATVNNKKKKHLSGREFIHVKSSSKIINTLKAIAVITFSLAFGYLLSCDLNPDRKWTCGDFALAHRRTIELNIFLRN